MRFIDIKTVYLNTDNEEQILLQKLEGFAKILT